MPPKRRGGHVHGEQEDRLREENQQLRRQLMDLTQRLEALEVATQEEEDETSSASSLLSNVRRSNESRRWEAGLRFDIPEFFGMLTPDDCLDWLATINEILEFKERYNQSTDKPSSGPTGTGGGDAGYQKSSIIRPQDGSSSTIKCFKCGEVGHRASNCKSAKGNIGKGLLIELGEPAGDLPFDLVGDPIYDESREDTHEEKLQHVHDVVKQRLGDSNARYKQAADKKHREVIFEPGDFVWAVMMKERHPIGDYGKLTDKKIGPLEVLERLNNNAYRLKLPSHFKTSDVFNVKHLIPYVGDFSDDDFANSRANSFQPRGTDAMPIEKDLELQDSNPKQLRRSDQAVKKKLSPDYIYF
ncbi:hypothetical protein MRB53_017006 [Persea americana]|uniref:Uncharacterized protein n=1 Tax=Persea americana TaxID=3435 RepID=A0ACC2M3Q2_PERAE|nr:hypothetical protein MRB53_017006 [Persea americana]